MSYPPQTNLVPQRRGDTWQGIGSITVTRNGDPLDLTGARIDMQLRLRPANGAVAASWSTEDDSIEMIDAELGKFKVNGRLMDIEAATYRYDIQITLLASVEYPAGRTLTIAQGSWNIYQDITRI